MNMNGLIINEELVERFGKTSLIIGILLIITGIIGILLPVLMSLNVAIFVAAYSLIGAVVWLVHTFKYARKSVLDWIKPIILFVTGAYMLINPAIGVAAIGLVLTFYLMIDAFGSFLFAQLRYPESGWGWMVVNGLFSLVLGAMILAGWPSTSFWFVGFYIAISLFFDGVALAMIGWNIKKAANA
jgi:uncharacterized membrane protein HdeD (DUF308 family)